MKNLSYKLTLLGFLLKLSYIIYAQQSSLQYYHPNDKRSLNQFETDKTDTVQFDHVRVRIGGDFAMQFQGLNQSNMANNLVDLGSDFNLPTANLNLDVQLLNGLRMHLRTYLSSRHHPEAWIKGGHIQVDKLDFIKPGFMEGFMKYTTIRIGMDEFNYGDAHFRRSDNARAIFNPFVGNYIMDAFSTEAFGEVTFQYKSWLAVLGITNGKLNQNVAVNSNSDNQPSYFGKLGFDKELSEDFRVRLTASGYMNYGTTTGTWLYGGDRAGSRYYNVLWTVPSGGGAAVGSNFDGRYNARFTKLTALQFNPFIKFKGFEFFGIYEFAHGSNEFTTPITDKEGAFTQLGAELLFRFGKDEKFYVGGRYNQVYGKMRESDSETLDVMRINGGAGWFISNNILIKAEYVRQDYNGNGWTGKFDGATFSGVVAEAVISF